MQEQQLKIQLEGTVTINHLDRNGKVIHSEEHKNAILPTHRRILAHNMGAQAGTYVDKMEVFNNTNSLAAITNVVSSVNAPTAGPYIIEFTGIFTIPSFSGTFNRVVLGTNNFESFSELNINPALVKLATEQIAIIWKIKFI